MQVVLSMELLDRGVHLSLSHSRVLEAIESQEIRSTETMQELNNKCKTKISNLDIPNNIISNRENIMMQICKEELLSQVTLKIPNLPCMEVINRQDYKVTH